MRKVLRRRDKRGHKIALRCRDRCETALDIALDIALETALVWHAKCNKIISVQHIPRYFDEVTRVSCTE